jgi:hypothetical protein
MKRYKPFKFEEKIRQTDSMFVSPTNIRFSLDNFKIPELNNIDSFMGVIDYINKNIKAIDEESNNRRIQIFKELELFCKELTTEYNIKVEEIRNALYQWGLGTIVDIQNSLLNKVKEYE